MLQGRIEIEDKIDSSVQEKLNKLPDCIVEWYYVLKARGNTTKSCREYLYKVEHFFETMELLDTDVDEITPADITRYFSIIQYKKDHDGNKVKTSGAYLTSVWFALNNFFEYQLDIGQIDKNHMKIVKTAKNKENITNTEAKMLTANDFKKMLCHVPGDNNVIKKRNKAILLIYMTTGMRRDALCQMNLDDIDLETHKVNIIDKGEKKHHYVLNDEVTTAVKEWILVREGICKKVNSDALFITYQGNRITGNSVYNMITECSSLAFEKAISPHKLRSGLCSILYEQTHDIEFVRKAIGHKNIATTQRYIVTEGNEKEEASKIMAGLL